MCTFIIWIVTNSSYFHFQKETEIESKMIDLILIIIALVATFLPMIEICIYIALFLYINQHNNTVAAGMSPISNAIFGCEGRC